MGRKKRLLCECGKVHLIETTQAGSSLPCDCGTEILVPTLREIAQLPDAEEMPSTPRRSRWTHQQAIFFAVGVVIFFLGLGAATVLFSTRPAAQLPQPAGKVALLDMHLATLSPAETLDLWGYYQRAPRLMVELSKRIDENRSQRRLYTTLAWTLLASGTAIGASCVIFSLRLGKPREQI